MFLLYKGLLYSPLSMLKEALKLLEKSVILHFKPLFINRAKSTRIQSKATTRWVSGAACEPGGSVFREISLGWERGILQANLSGTWVSDRLCNRLHYTEPRCFTAILIASSHVPLGFCAPGPSAQAEQRVIWSGKGREEEEYIRGRQCSVNVEQWRPCDSEIAIGGQQTKIHLA